MVEGARVSWIHPDLQWHTSVGERKNLSAPCPFATVRLCPRYFESVSLLGDQGITTAVGSVPQWRALFGLEP